MNYETWPYLPLEKWINLDLEHFVGDCLIVGFRCKDQSGTECLKWTLIKNTYTPAITVCLNPVQTKRHYNGARGKLRYDPPAGTTPLPRPTINILKKKNLTSKVNLWPPQFMFTILGLATTINPTYFKVIKPTSIRLRLVGFKPKSPPTAGKKIKNGYVPSLVNSRQKVK